MFFYDERMKAVKLYIQYDLSVAKVTREMGYPKNQHTLTNWYKEYKETKSLHLKRPSKEKFSEEQKRTAIQYCQMPRSLYGSGHLTCYTQHGYWLTDLNADALSEEEIADEIQYHMQDDDEFTQEEADTLLNKFKLPE